VQQTQPGLMWSPTTTTLQASTQHLWTSESSGSSLSVLLPHSTCIVGRLPAPAAGFIPDLCSNSFPSVSHPPHTRCADCLRCLRRYVSQHQQHTTLLAQFGELSAALSSVPLPLQLQTQQWQVLADLQPRVKLAEWHESCSKSHEHFAQKVCIGAGAECVCVCVCVGGGGG
jgi:hypothetical protein